MAFDEMMAQIRELLRQQGRVSYQALKRRFDLDDSYLADLKVELIDALRVAVDENDKVLVWTSSGAEPERMAPTPASYTPKHLAERIRSQQQALESRGGREGERKTITALFADLKGSTALQEGLDPEEARAVIDPALQIMMDAVHRYEGYVAQALGDGILGLFGAPLAHEDHAQRAVYAALRMQEELRRYSERVRLQHGAPLAMRVGLNTGEVVVRSIRKEDLHTDYVPVGHSINLAARMEQMTTPGSILITAYTQKLVQGYFVLKALGEAAIKGMERSLAVYEVTGVGQLRTRLQVAERRGLTRFVGRQQELQQMQRALDQAREGRGQVIGIMGEPGMGKSRLVHEFKASAHGFAIFEAYSASHGKSSPYLPITELLKGYFQIQLQDDEHTRREKIIGKILGLDRSLEDVLPYYFALLNIEDPDSPLLQMDPLMRRRKTFDALKRATLRASLEQPLLLIFEDLHWIDSETQGYLDSLVESIGNEEIDDHYGDLAHHYTRSGNIEKAIEYLLLAGAQAAQRSANADAVDHFGTAVTLIESLPTSPGRHKQTFTALVALAVNLSIVKGIAAIEVGEAYSRARVLCEEGGSPSELCAVLIGYRVHHLVRGNHLKALEYAEELLRIAEFTQDPALICHGHFATGISNLSLGNMVEARVHIRHGLDLYDYERDHAQTPRYGFDPGVGSLLTVSYVHWMLGYPGQAAKAHVEASTLARKVGHPYLMAYVLTCDAIVQRIKGDYLACQAATDVLVALAEEHKYPEWYAYGVVLRGWARSHATEDDAVADVMQGLSGLAQIHSKYHHPLWMGSLAEIHAKRRSFRPCANRRRRRDRGRRTNRRTLVRR